MEEEQFMILYIKQKQLNQDYVNFIYTKFMLFLWQKNSITFPGVPGLSVRF